MNHASAMQQYRLNQLPIRVVATASRAILEIAGQGDGWRSRQSVPSLEPQLTSEPWWLIRVPAGKTVGKGQLESLGFATHTEGRADVKGDFHEAEITVKQISKCPIYWAFYEINMKANGLKTMATASNYRPCGEGCGESRGTQKEVSNG